MIFCSLVIVGVLSKRRGRTLRTPTTPRPASASASAMTPIGRLSLNYCTFGMLRAHGQTAVTHGRQDLADRTFVHFNAKAPLDLLAPINPPPANVQRRIGPSLDERGEL